MALVQLDLNNMKFCDNIEVTGRGDLIIHQSDGTNVPISKDCICITEEPSNTFTSAINDNKLVSLSSLASYDKKIKEYIDKKIDEKINSLNKSQNKYKIITGESD